MRAKATSIAMEIITTAGRVRAAWPVEYFLPLANEYLRLQAAGNTTLPDLLGEHGRPMPSGVRESGLSDG